jgi:hypothetical protein
MTSIPPLPRLAPDADKWSAGRVLVIGGSRGMSGAPRFASRGAWAAGVGLVTLAVPEGVRAECAADRMREMTAGIPETHAGTAAYPALRRLRALAASADAVLLGPGAGRHPDTCALHRVLVRDLPGADRGRRRRALRACRRHERGAAGGRTARAHAASRRGCTPLAGRRRRRSPRIPTRPRRRWPRSATSSWC